MRDVNNYDDQKLILYVCFRMNLSPVIIQILQSLTMVTKTELTHYQRRGF